MANDWLRVDCREVAQEETIEEMRKRVASRFGVTVQGQFVTLRWYGEDKAFKEVQMVVIAADDGRSFNEEDNA